ncbi:MAG: hypothetical protein JWM64_1447 [Frankiales bacterium]|nr:hypothetical protein [Frankiales bacterium]
MGVFCRQCGKDQTREVCDGCGGPAPAAPR